MATSANAGDFTCAELQVINVNLDEIWADNRVNKDYVSFAESLKAIMAEQSATLDLLENSEKDNEIKVYWAADCSTSLTDCVDDCVIGGPEPEAQCKNYILDICKTAGFSIKEKTFRTSNLSRDMVVAKAMMKRMKELDEFLAQSIITKLNTFDGVNAFPGIGVVVGNTTYIAPSFWSPDIMAYFAQVSMMNKFSSPYMLHGNNLWTQNFLAQANNLNQDQKDQMAKLGTMRQYWDPFNMAVVNGVEKISYLIDRGAVAFANKAYYPLNAPIEYKTQSRYSIESKSIPGVFYDVVYTNVCANNDITHSWSLYVKAGIFLNPVGCDTNNTGVLSFVCGVQP